jgi:hypothetical protein
MEENEMTRGIKGLVNAAITRTIDALENMQEQTVENKVGRFIIQEINSKDNTIYILNAFARRYDIQRPEEIRIKPEIVGGDLTIHKYHVTYGDYSVMNAPTLTSLLQDITKSTLVRDEVIASEVNNALKTAVQF